MQHFTFILLLFFCLTGGLQAQWESLGTGTTTTPRIYFALDVVDAQNVWGITIHPSSPIATREVVRSTDGGATWAVTDLPALAETYYTVDVKAIDENTAWVLSVNLPTQDRVKIFKTSDGGVSWTEQLGGFNDSGQAAAILHFFNENDGLCFGSPGTGDPSVDTINIFKTSDGGSTWEEILSPALPELLPGEGNWVYSNNGNYETKGDTIWFLSRARRVFRSIDKGANWEAYDIGINGGPVTGIAFADAQNGILVSTQPNGAARTEDGGETWTEIPLPALPAAGSIEYIPGTKSTYVVSPGGFLGGSNMAISKDGGMTWTSSNFDVATKCLQFISPTVGFAGGSISTSQNRGLYQWTGNLSDPIYVNHTATGANDGTSWEDAFVGLQSALAAADSTSQIWVAQGTYKPSSPSMHPDSTLFQDTVGVRLYGGFAGTETEVEQRDAEANPTILSGDLLGDDIAGNFAENRDDNARHVLYVFHANRSLIDGFTITSGNALVGEVFGDLAYQGGGLLAFANIDVSNCIFIDNQGGQGAGMVWGSGNFSVTNCSFLQNNSTFGAMLAANGTGIPSSITGSYFEGNASTSVGALYSFNCDIAIEGNTFENNNGDYSGALAVDLGRATVRNNTFENNISTQLGGGMTMGNSAGIIENNTFGNNRAEFSGGGIFIYQNDNGPVGNEISLLNNQFLNNSSAIRGGALTFNNFNNAAVLTMSDCFFEENETGFEGGGVSFSNITGFMEIGEYTSSFFLERNTFISNIAPNGGGLLLNNEADEMNVSILSSTFEDNRATTDGGAIKAETSNANGINLQMENLDLIGNSADEKGGGLYLDVSVPCRLLNSVISDGRGGDGSALYLQSSSEMSVENTLISGNSGSWAITNNDTLNLTGVTCANNGVGLFQEGDATIRFQNTIMDNEENYLGFTDNYTSQGGNLSSDATLAAGLTGSDGFLDLNETDPLLGMDFVPTSSSPCVDAGSPDGISQEVDLAGNERIMGDQIDMGAYETPFSTPVQDLANGIRMDVFPNPFIHEIQLTSDEPILALELFDVQGKLLAKQLNSTALQGLSGLPAGVYFLKIATERGISSAEVIKR